MSKMLSVAMVTHLRIQKHLAHVPFARHIRLLEEQGLKLSTGTVANYMKTGTELLRPLYDRLWEISPKEKHWHVDETSWRKFVEREGKQGYRWWMWIWVSPQVTLYVLDPTRASSVITE